MDVKIRKRRKGYISTKRVSGQGNHCKKLRNHAAKSKGVDGDWISQLPVDILCDIFCRIPSETIFSCRCVSKAFLKICSDPQFAKFRHTKPPNSDSCLIIQPIYSDSDLSLAYIDDLEKNWDFDYCPMQVMAKPNVISQSQVHLFAFLVGSINGLLCVSYKAPNAPHIPTLCICNPILGEFTLLPKARLNAAYRWYAAFGFCPKTNQYKVIRFVSSLYSEIHTVGTDYWTTIENVPFPHNPGSLQPSSLNGNVHWITDNSEASNLICSINLETELWEYISPPSQINQKTLRRINFLTVGARGGLLCVCYVRVDIQLLEVCVMKDYGVKESWSKELTIDLKSTFGFDPRKLYMIPRRILNNGDLLLSYTSNSIVYYNARKGTYRDIAPWESYDAVAHVASFISLKDIVGQENVEVVQRAKIRVHWSSPDWGIKYYNNYIAFRLGW